jgi:hypothetical protein
LITAGMILIMAGAASIAAGTNWIDRGNIFIHSNGTS